MLRFAAEGHSQAGAQENPFAVIFWARQLVAFKYRLLREQPPANITPTRIFIFRLSPVLYPEVE